MSKRRTAPAVTASAEQPLADAVDRFIQNMDCLHAMRRLYMESVRAYNAAVLADPGSKGSQRALAEQEHRTLHRNWRDMVDVVTRDGRKLAGALEVFGHDSGSVLKVLNLLRSTDRGPGRASGPESAYNLWTDSVKTELQRLSIRRRTGDTWVPVGVFSLTDVKAKLGVGDRTIMNRATDGKTIKGHTVQRIGHGQYELSRLGSPPALPA